MRSVEETADIPPTLEELADLLVVETTEEKPRNGSMGYRTVVYRRDDDTFWSVCSWIGSGGDIKAQHTQRVYPHTTTKTVFRSWE